MPFRFLKKWATVGAIALITVVGLTQHSRAQKSLDYASFYCGTHEGKAATIADHPRRGEITLIVWETDYFIEAGYNPQTRCRLVSERFEDFQRIGSLSKIAPGRTNNLPVLCAIGQLDNYTNNCPDFNVLMTLKPGDDAQQMVIEIGNLNQDNSTTPLRHFRRNSIQNIDTLFCLNSPNILEQYKSIIVLNINTMLNCSAPAK